MDSNNVNISGAGQEVEGNGGNKVCAQAFDNAFEDEDGTGGMHDSGSAKSTEPTNNRGGFEHPVLERELSQASLQSFPTPPNFPPSDYDFTQCLEGFKAPVSPGANGSSGGLPSLFLFAEDDLGITAPCLHNPSRPGDPSIISGAQQPLECTSAACQDAGPQRSGDEVETLTTQPYECMEATADGNTEMHGCHCSVKTSTTEPPLRSPSEVPNAVSLDSTTKTPQISPSVKDKKNPRKRKLDLDSATAFFETAKLMQCATNGQSEKRGFRETYIQFCSSPSAKNVSITPDQYRMKARSFLGERQTRGKAREQLFEKFTSEACVEAELARSFSHCKQEGFSFAPITTYLWNEIQLARQEVQHVQKARRAQVGENCTHEVQKAREKKPSFSGGSYWPEPARQCLVDLLVDSHQRHCMTVSQIAAASYWFLTKFHVEVIIYSRCACLDCGLWGMYGKQSTPGQSVLEYTRLQFEVYHVLLSAHKYDDPTLLERCPQLLALSERQRKSLLGKLHDCTNCPRCRSSSKSARTRCNSSSSYESIDDGYGDDHEDKNEDEDLMDEGTGIQRITADGAAAVAHTLFPQSEDFLDDEDSDEDDEDDEKIKYEENAIILSLDRLALNNH